MKQKTWILKIKKGKDNNDAGLIAQNIFTGEFIFYDKEFSEKIDGDKTFTEYNMLSENHFKKIEHFLREDGYTLENCINSYYPAIDKYKYSERYFILKEYGKQWVLKVEKELQSGSILIAKDVETGRIITSQYFSTKFLPGETITPSELGEAFLYQLRKEGYDLENIKNEKAIINADFFNFLLEEKDNDDPWVLKIHRIKDNVDIIAKDVNTGEIIASKKSFGFFVSSFRITYQELKNLLLSDVNIYGYRVENIMNDIDENGNYIINEEKFEKENTEQKSNKNRVLKEFDNFILKYENNSDNNSKKEKGYNPWVLEIDKHFFSVVVKAKDVITGKIITKKKYFFFDENNKLGDIELKEFESSVFKYGYFLADITNNFDEDGYCILEREKSKKQSKNWILKFEKYPYSNFIKIIAKDINTGEIIADRKINSFNMHKNIFTYTFQSSKDLFLLQLNKHGYYLENIMNDIDEDGNYILEEDKTIKNDSNYYKTGKNKSLKDCSNDELIQEINNRLQK